MLEKVTNLVLVLSLRDRLCLLNRFSMNKILLILFLFVWSNGFAQDVIVKKDGSTILSKILEVNTADIKYKKYSNLDGPTYTILKTELLSINYKNGECEKFTLEAVGDVSKTTSSVSNDTLNREWLDFMNNRRATYKEAQENKKAKWQYRILKIHHDSKVADNNVYITCSVRNIYYEKFSGRKALESNISFTLDNRSDNVVYLDLGNCFFKKGYKTENYYKNTATQTSKDKNVGGAVNAGTITDVLGIGGVIGNIANGINVGGNKGSSTGVTVFSQRIIALAPHSSYRFEDMDLYRSEDQYTKTEKYTVGSSVSFHEPQNINDCPWNLVLSYSTDEGFKTKNVMNVGIYVSEIITFPKGKGDVYLIKTDKYIKYEGLEPLHYIYRTE